MDKMGTIESTSKHLMILDETKLKRLTFSEVFRFFFFLVQTCAHIFDQTGCHIRVKKS